MPYHPCRSKDKRMPLTRRGMGQGQGYLSQLSPAAAAATIVSHSAATPVDTSSTVNASSAVNATSIGDAAAIDAATIVPRSAGRIGIIAAGLPIAATASRPVIYPATNHTSPIDRSAAVNSAPSIGGSAPISAAPASDRRHERTRVGGIDDRRRGVHDLTDSLQWWRNK